MLYDAHILKQFSWISVDLHKYCSRKVQNCFFFLLKHLLNYSLTEMLRPSLIYIACFPSLSSAQTDAWLLIISYTVDFPIWLYLTALLQYLDLKRCSCKTMQPVYQEWKDSNPSSINQLCTTNTFSLTADWCCASNCALRWLIIKKWWGTLKVDAGSDGKLGINWWWPYMI